MRSNSLKVTARTSESEIGNFLTLAVMIDVGGNQKCVVLAVHSPFNNFIFILLLVTLISLEIVINYYHRY